MRIALLALVLSGCALPIASANPYAGGTREHECWRAAWNASETAQRIHSALVDWSVFEQCIKDGRRGAVNTDAALTRGT